jgi:hypothetical protein
MTGALFFAAPASAVRPPGGGGPNKGEFSTNLAATPTPFNETDGVVIVVTRSSPKRGASVTVSPSVIAEGSAAEDPADFDSSPMVVTFAAGVTTMNVAIPVVDDAAVEDDESFRVDLTSPSKGYSLNAASSGGEIVIVDDDTPVNAAPTADATSASGNEDEGAIMVNISGHDADGDGLTFTVGTATNGLVSVPADTTCDLNTPSECLATLTYTPNANFYGSDSFTYTVNDGTADSTPATATITILPFGDAPTADATSASGNEDGGAITVNLSGHDADGDGLTFTAGTATNGLVTVPADTTCDLNTPSECLATVTYTPNANFYGSDSFTYTVNDGTADSTPATATITILPVNDAPSFAKGSDQTLNEDAGAQSVPSWATAISKGPANESGQTLQSEVTANDNPALFAAGPSISPTGTLTYTPAANRHGVANVTIRLVDNGGIANGGVDASTTETFVVTVTSINDAPVAAAKAYTVPANVTTSFTGLLVGATDPNDVAGEGTWSASFTLGSITVGAGCIECTVSNVNNSDGSFNFKQPNPGTYSLTYTVMDNGLPAPGKISAPQIITFTVV